MASFHNVTYRSLVQTLPPKINLANVKYQEASETCPSCSSIVPDRTRAKNGLIKTSYERTDLYPDFPGLKASSKAGCGLCRLIRKEIRAAWAVRPMEEWGLGPLNEKDGLWDELFASPWDRKVRIHKALFATSRTTKGSASSAVDTANEDCENEMVVSLSFEFGPLTLLRSTYEEGRFGEIGRVISFKVFDSQDMDAVTEEAKRRLPSPVTLSPENIDIISKWINDCKSKHLKCQIATSSWVPTRLIDVRPPRGSQGVRLVETQEWDLGLPYAALSHMWGDISNRPPLRTMRSNFQAFKTSIPMTLLSKNFADAVIVTREIGLKYLWIDSLCIIQDSPFDWQQEAVTMHKVYSYAEVTIVATSATAANAGFLQRQLSAVSAAKIGYSIEEKPEANINCMILAGQDDRESGNWLGDVNSSLWNTRGWTMQERSLSTRMLHFCKNKLYFECRTCQTSEENEPFHGHRQFGLWPRDGNWMQQSTASPPEDTETPRSNLYKKWISTVTEYSRRRLTKDLDKLPAIQSVAAEMSATINDTYISFAGMWKEHLRHDLLWQVKDGPASKPKSYRAPTWSWASMDASLIWYGGAVHAKPDHHFLSQELFEVLDVGDSGVDPERHFLKIKSFLIPIAFIVECDEDERWVYATRGVFPHDIFISTTSLDDSDAIDVNISMLPLRGGHDAVDVGVDECVKFAEGRLDLDDKDDLTNSDRPLFYLHINHSCRPSGLILEAEWGVKRAWKRVGVATVFTKDNDLFHQPCVNRTREVTLV